MLASGWPGYWFVTFSALLAMIKDGMDINAPHVKMLTMDKMRATKAMVVGTATACMLPTGIAYPCCIMGCAWPITWGCWGCCSGTGCMEAISSLLT